MESQCRPDLGARIAYATVPRLSDLTAALTVGALDESFVAGGGRLAFLRSVGTPTHDA